MEQHARGGHKRAKRSFPARIAQPRRPCDAARMAEIINLNRFRKAAARQEARTKADANAAKFGRTKAQKQLEEAQAQKARDLLDGAKRDDDET